MAILKQERHVALVSGAQQAFVITSQMLSAVIPDDLPHLNVFVMSVADVNDPKQDTLARVAMIADLTTLPIGRDPGIAAPGPNGIEYLTSATANSYSTLETANDAAKAFSDRVSQLITDWRTFRTQFNAPDPTPALITVPAVDTSQLQALIDAYTVAKQARYQAQTDKAAADATLARAQADYAYKFNLSASTSTIAGEALSTQSNLSLTIAQFGSLLAAGNAFFAANSGGTGAATFLTAITTGTSQQAAMPGFSATAAQLVSDMTSYNTARAADEATATTTLTTAQSDQITKAQTLASAHTTESAALAAILAVCPDFDKHTIPFVPDTEP